MYKYHPFSLDILKYNVIIEEATTINHLCDVLKDVESIEVGAYTNSIIIYICIHTHTHTHTHTHYTKKDSEKYVKTVNSAVELLRKNNGR